MRKKGTYIAATGYMDLREVVQSSNGFVQATKECGVTAAQDLKLMVGVLVSQRTMRGETNKWPGRYPPIERVPELFSLQNEHILNTIHYNTKDESTIDEQIDAVVKAAPNIHAIQLNIRWASPIKLQRVRRKYPDLRIILQIGTGALSDVEEPEDIFIGQALRSYEGTIDDFLVDPSGGAGVPFDIWRTFACIADADIPPSMSAGAAGGLNAERVPLLRGLMRRFGPINIDAEGQLRTPMDQGDKMILPKTVDYIHAGVKEIARAIQARTVAA